MSGRHALSGDVKGGCRSGGGGERQRGEACTLIHIIL